MAPCPMVMSAPMMHGRETGVDVDDAAVLNVGPRTDPDVVTVSPKHGAVPDRGIRADLHIADQDGRFRDNGGGVDRWRHPVMGTDQGGHYETSRVS